MDSKIPSQAKAYMKKVKANKKRENKLVQSNKQSTTVIINSDLSKRKRASKPAPTSNYPNIVYLQPSQPTMNLPPQQYDQGLNQFRSNPIYQNPCRMQQMSRALNAPPLYQVEQPLEQPAPSPPPPDLPDIVDQQNFVEQLARPPRAVPIGSIPAVQGFIQNQAVNDLNRQVDLEVNALNDYGGADAQQVGDIPYAEVVAQLDAEMANDPIVSGFGRMTVPQMKSAIIARARGGDKK